jgi:2-dehydro-3-deoxy-phosphogluconate aldolase
MSLTKLKKFEDRVLFNFLAFSRENAEQVMEASRGYVVPGIVSTDYEDIKLAVAKVKELKEVSPVVSIGLGGSGDTRMWRKVLDIALESDPGHINQPFETSPFATGVLTQAGIPQFCNALITPTGEVGKIQVTNGKKYDVNEFIEICALLGIQSIKVMPVKGIQHLDELVYIADTAARNGIYGIEPAGGIDETNIKELVSRLLGTGIHFIMPHIFGSTIDKKNRRTIPEKVEEIVDQMQ